MKIQEKDIQTTSSVEFEDKHAMSVDLTNLPLIMESLTYIYSNTNLAIAREYISNAVDATVEYLEATGFDAVSFPKPVEVEITRPSTDDMFDSDDTRVSEFVVRDYGIGMTREDLKHVFSVYGASTKRQDNSQIGGFGLGCKTALAATSTFTVISVKNGIKNTVFIAKDSSGVPELNFLPSQETDEHSGTTIRIPIVNASEMEAVFTPLFLMGFPHGSIKVNGEFPEVSVYDESMFTPVAEAGWLLSDLSQSDFLSISAVNALVGPIAYQIPIREVPELGLWLQDNPNAQSLLSKGVVRLGIGSVSLTRSRDNLIFNRHTNDSILSVVKEFVSGAEALLIDGLQACVDKQEVIIYVQQLHEVAKFTFPAGLTWNGELVPSHSPLLIDLLNGVVSDGHPPVIEGVMSMDIDKSTSKKTPHLTRVSNKQTFGHSYTKKVLITGVLEDSVKLKSFMRSRNLWMDELGVEGFYSTESAKTDLSYWADGFFNQIYSADEFEALLTELRRKRRNSSAQNRTSSKERKPFPIRRLVVSPYTSSHRRERLFSGDTTSAAPYSSYFVSDTLKSLIENYDSENSTIAVITPDTGNAEFKFSDFYNLNTNWAKFLLGTLQDWYVKTTGKSLIPVAGMPRSRYSSVADTDFDGEVLSLTQLLKEAVEAGMLEARIDEVITARNQALPSVEALSLPEWFSELVGQFGTSRSGEITQWLDATYISLINEYVALSANNLPSADAETIFLAQIYSFLLNPIIPEKYRLTHSLLPAEEKLSEKFNAISQSSMLDSLFVRSYIMTTEGRIEAYKYANSLLGV